MYNLKFKLSFLTSCLVFMPLVSHAMGLGKMTINSGIGELLNAEIVLFATQEELITASARIAPDDVFAEKGIEKYSSLSDVRITIGRRPDGVPVLRLTSQRPINDSFLDMLIQVDWASGYLLREYTALLDPPSYGGRAGATSEVAAKPPVATTNSKTAPISPKKNETPVSTSDFSPNEIKVEKGETLYSIAVANKVEGVSLEQLLVGLYQANPDAFSGNNMNRLKAGEILSIPEQEKLQAMSQSKAIEEIRVQAADWDAYRNQLSNMVATSASSQEVMNSQMADGKIVAPAKDNAASQQNGSRDVIKLSKEEVDNAKTRLTKLQEEVTARKKEAEEASQRVADLEKQLNDLQKLLEIKSKALEDAKKISQ